MALYIYDKVVNIEDIRQYLIEHDFYGVTVHGFKVEERIQKIYVGININSMYREIDIDFNDWIQWIRNSKLNKIGI